MGRLDGATEGYRRGRQVENVSENEGKHNQGDQDSLYESVDDRV